MRKSRQEITDRSILEEILNTQVVCRLAMVDEGRAYIIPVNYGYREGCMYIHSAPAGKKIDLIRQNAEISFEVEEKVEITTGERACDWSTRYRSVIGHGHMEILSDDASKQLGLEVLMDQHGAPELKEFEPKNMKAMVILKLTIDSMTGKQSSHYT